MDIEISIAREDDGTNGLMKEEVKKDEGGAFKEMLEDEVDSLNDEEIWRSRWERINNALAIEQNGEPDPAQLNAATQRIENTIFNAGVEEFISAFESLANLIHPIFIFHIVEAWGNSVLHFAVDVGKDDILRLALDFVPDRFLEAQNNTGNTPLHVAAMYKRSRAVAMLIGRMRKLPDEDKYRILRMRNQVGNTALHEAVLNGHVNGVRHLLNEDLEAVYWMNANCMSPLYLAVLSEEPEIHKLLFSLQLEPSRIQGLPPIHGAILCEHLGLAAKLLEENKELFVMTDSTVGNVFHLAAYLNRTEVFKFLESRTAHLVRQRDKNGDLPIHIAGKMGHVEVIEKLLPLGHWPNRQGQNLLQVAAKYGRASAVRYMLRRPELGKRINERDSRGNTALHLAAMHSQPAALIRLVLDERINPVLLNHQHLTALDIAINRVRREWTLRKQLALMVLASTCGKTPAGNEAFSIMDADKKKPNMEHVKNLIGNRSVVAALVATMTFAAGFAVPGGFTGSDTASKDDRGMATMLDNRMFQVFAISNTIAMFCSMIAAVILLWAQQNDVRTAIVAYRHSMLPLKIALPAMSAAFLTGVTLTVGKLPWLANTIFYLGLVFLLIIIVAKLLEDPPLIWSRRRPIRIMVSWLVLAYIYLWEVETDLLDELEENRTTGWTSPRRLPDDEESVCGDAAPPNH